MLDYILPFLIFVSLGVIVYIVGKHLPELKKISQDNLNEREDKDKKAIDRFKGGFYKGGKFFKNSLLSLVEFFIKKIKQFLHLVHFWVLKTRKGSSEGDDLSRENEVKKELIASEEQSLERIIEDDLSREVEVNIKKESLVHDDIEVEKEVVAIKDSKKEIETEIEIEKDVLEDEAQADENEDVKKTSKIESFFLDKNNEDEDDDDDDDHDDDDNETDVEIKNSSPSFLSGMLNSFKNKFKKSENKTDKNREEDDENSDELFSDGIVNVSDSGYENDRVDESVLIKEVVKVPKKEIDIDDEIGVDRSILEKKIVNKIAKNPKDMENYRELGELYIKMKNFSDAEECYKQVLRVHLRDVDAKRKLEKIKLLKRMG